MKFEKWMNAIDKECQARFMMSIYDLPDQDFQGYFKEGMTPSEALDEIADQENMDCDEDASAKNDALIAEEETKSAAVWLDDEIMARFEDEEGELSIAQAEQIASLAQSWGLR